MARREPILIVGGGLGGLTTALALSRRGLGARVLEGAPEFGAIGYGIQFGPNAFHVFDRLGLMEPVLAVADSPAVVLMRDALDGKELVRIPTGQSLRALNIPTSSFTESIYTTCCSTSADEVMRSSLCPMHWSPALMIGAIAWQLRRRTGEHFRVPPSSPRTVFARFSDKNSSVTVNRAPAAMPRCEP